MFKALFEVLTKYVGVKTVSIVALIFIGAFSWVWITKNFVTTEAHADDMGSVKKLVHREAEDIRLGVLIGDATQKMDTLQLRRELLQQRVYEFEDKFEETQKPKWERRLETTEGDLEKVEDRIEELNQELQDASIKKHSTSNGDSQ